jgi:PAS domain S-box-containing protein
MDSDRNAIRERILLDMSEGVIVIGLKGRIELINPKACELLALSESEAMGKPFAGLFFEHEENDAFSQTVLDAIYDAQGLHVAVVPYFDGETTRRLHVTTSFLRDDGRRIGVIAVLSDVSELVRLREDVERKNRQITALLESVVEALSSAIDERSHYTANHTKNMARFAEAFLDWLHGAGDPVRFDEERRREFLMSVWLHDVGKLTVPLHIMDKADRLGDALGDVRARLRIIGLLDSLAEARGEISADEAARRRQELDGTREFIERIDRAGFLPEEDFRRVEELAARTFTDEGGAVRPWITEEECLRLSIRKGTLTAAEREVMQSHAAVTRRILSHISFPDSYADVPAWAGAHHEQLNGRGYPDGLTADAIPMEVRLLTILDVFEALTAKDRPYKKPFPPDKALAILRDMAREGAVDGELLALFERSRAWE